MKRTPQAKIIRQALGLTQEEFAARFHIPIGTFRDWEQNRKEPDQTAKTYLKVIARLRDKVAKALDEPLCGSPRPRCHEAAAGVVPISGPNFWPSGDCAPRGQDQPTASSLRARGWLPVRGRGQP
jgi:putative transcriptional regulator